MMQQLTRSISLLWRMVGPRAAAANNNTIASKSRWTALERYCSVKRFVDDEADRIQRSFFKGIITDDHCVGRSRTISILKSPIFEWKTGKRDEIRFLKFRPYFEDNEALLLKRIVESVPYNTDHIYICRHNIGETYIHLALVENAVLANRSIHPALIVRKKEYISLYKMFMPKSAYLKYIPILRSDLDAHVEGEFYYNRRRIISGSKDILDRLRSDRLQNNGANVVDFIRSDMGLDRSARMRKPNICENSQRNLRDKMKAIDLDLGNFILLTPEATTIRELDQGFWLRIIERLLDKGFDLYLNQTRATQSPYPLKTIELSIEEVYILALEARGIVGVASGLNVLLSSTSTSMDILYTDTGGGCSATEILDLFSISNLPNCSRERVREYNTEHMTMDAIADEIVGRYSQTSPLTQCFPTTGILQ